MIFTDYEPGLYPGTDERIYHDTPIEIASNSGLKPFSLTEAHFEQEKIIGKKTVSLGFGAAYHVCILEPDSFDERVMPTPDCCCKKGDGKPCTNPATFMQGPIGYCGVHQGKAHGIVVPVSEVTDVIMVSQADLDHMLRMRDVLLADEDVCALLAGGNREGAMLWRDPETGILCKGKYDHWNEDLEVLPDLKTTKDATEDGWPGEMWNYSYYTQAPMYLGGMALSGGPTLKDFVNIAQEKVPPYAYGIYYVDQKTKDAGRREFERRLRRFKAYLERGDRPASASYTQGIRATGLKPWHLSQLERQEP